MKPTNNSNLKTNKMQQYILAIDIGTTAFKAAIVDETGKVCSSRTCEYNIITPHAGWAEMDINVYVETFRTAVAAVISDAGITPDDIITIGMSSQGETTIFLDEHGYPLRRAIVWFDTRAAREAQIIVDTFGAESIQRHTGQVGVDAIWPGAKILWLRENEPDVYEKLGKIVQLKGYMSYLLTGNMACEDSILGSSMYWDINTRKYWPQMLKLLGIDESKLPEVVAPGTDMGHITEEAAIRFGLSTRTTVNIGAIDLACGAVGVGNVRPGIFSDSTGSALCTVTMSDHIVLDPAMQMPCYCSAIPGKYMIHAYSTGGMFMRWFRDVFCDLEMEIEKSTGMNAYDQLDIMAENVPAGCDGLLALPHLQGSGPPDQNAHAKAVFYGLTIAHSKPHFVRAIMESVAMVLCRIIEATEALDVTIDSIITYGGGAKSKIWTQMKADATGLPVQTTTNDENATCLGAAILAGTACGIWDSIESAADSIVKNDIRYEPDPKLYPAYRDTLRRYNTLMECLKPMF